MLPKREKKTCMKIWKASLYCGNLFYLGLNLAVWAKTAINQAGHNRTLPRLNLGQKRLQIRTIDILNNTSSMKLRLRYAIQLFSKKEKKN